LSVRVGTSGMVCRRCGKPDQPTLTNGMCPPCHGQTVFAAARERERAPEYEVERLRREVAALEVRVKALEEERG
jgi:NMD protein affecting ribosome stability and mRNA decay